MSSGSSVGRPVDLLAAHVGLLTGTAERLITLSRRCVHHYFGNSVLASLIF
jgi:hypothetical protein